MAATIETAYDEMYGAFKVAWDAGAGAFNGSVVPEVFYDGIGVEGEKPQELPWARASIRHSTGVQGSLLGDAQVTRFTKSGIITIQTFYPLKLGGLVGARGLAQVAKSAFEGKTTASAVWFRNVSISEIGPDGPWYNVNVLAEFEYDELV